MSTATDLLAPIIGQRNVTLELVNALQDSDLARVDPESGWTVRQVLAHLASSTLGEAFTIRLAVGGELMPLSEEDRDAFNEAALAKSDTWNADRCRAELDEAHEALCEVFAEMAADDIDNAIRWTAWPARTIRSSIPYMVEHEDSHLDELRRALSR